MIVYGDHVVKQSTSIKNMNKSINCIITCAILKRSDEIEIIGYMSHAV